MRFDPERHEPGKKIVLGKEYKIFGKQIKGQGLGSKSFVPTINLNVEEFLLPKEGVYVTKTIITCRSARALNFCYILNTCN